MFYFVKTPTLLKKLYPECLWDVKTSENILYLTFDDGTTPKATPLVLEILKKQNENTHFFAIVKNSKKNLKKKLSKFILLFSCDCYFWC